MRGTALKRGIAAVGKRVEVWWSQGLVVASHAMQRRGDTVVIVYSARYYFVI